MWVTIYADASFHHATRRGSWAVWIKCEAGRIVRSGTCPDYVRDSESAELAAIFAGLHLATDAWSDVGGVWVRSDCVGALMLADPKAGRSTRHPATRTLQSKIHALLAARSIAFEQRWVKGHRLPVARDAWLNDAVDRLARSTNIESTSRVQALGGAPAPPRATSIPTTTLDANLRAQTRPNMQTKPTVSPAATQSPFPSTAHATEKPTGPKRRRRRKKKAPSAQRIE